MKPKYDPATRCYSAVGHGRGERRRWRPLPRNHGFIKQLQRIPTENGLVLRAKSFNSDYDASKITQKMDFAVFGKVLTVWRSEQV